ncbi:MAG: Exosortase/Archaeosortase [Methanophagales archaeon]|nr:exosortase H [Methanophagales archaeon]MCU4139689.1 Exosortase/Archaeosortase [Methanophagales archaeon]
MVRRREEMEKRRKVGKRKKVERDITHRNITIVERAREMEEALKYVALFLAFCLAFYLVYYFLRLRCSLSLLNDMTALILGGIFSLCGANVILKGATLSINGFVLEIIDECTAVFSSIVYCSAVLAYPTTLKKKCIGIAFGVPALYTINIIRLFILTLIGIHHPEMFEFVHVYLWQASFIIFVVVIFLLWLNSIR